MFEVCTYSNIGGREINEDSCLTRNDPEKGFLAVVCDGLGGHGGGAEASKIAVKTIDHLYEKEVLLEPDFFKVWFQAANQAVLDIQTTDCEMKTTMVCLSILDETAVWAHVGDSRLYHFENGKLRNQTVDHSVSQMAVLSGEIKQEEIRFHVDRNKLIRALGKADTINVEISEVCSLEKGVHAFLLCTDGFWEYVLEDEMEADLIQAETAKEWVAKMVKRLKKRAKPSHDNNTAIAVFYQTRES